MSSEHLEVERRYEVPAGARVPNLTALKGVRFIATGHEEVLEAVYYDTSSLALLDAGITVRRRTGGSDAGWTLELPGGADTRTEISLPLAEGEAVPSELTDYVVAWTCGHPLRPAASLTTHRVDHRLLGADERVLAVFGDDHVTAHANTDDGAALLSEWREWEFELVDGSRKLLERAGKLLPAAGARASLWPSKVHHAIGRQPITGTGGRVGPKSRAGDVLSAYLHEQVQVIRTRDHGVRTGDTDAVHKARVATRRLRSTLAVYRPLLRRNLTDSIRDELAWFASALGALRDAHVQQEHLLAALAAEPGDLVLGAVAGRINVELHANATSAQSTLLDVMTSDRYFHLLETLDELVGSPPTTGQARGQARKPMARGVNKALRRLTEKVALDARPSPEGRDQRLHDIRKAAKRVRYAAEVSAPALGRRADKWAATAEEIQELLGEHQDSVVLRNTLRAIGVRMHLDGENPFTIGRLHALQQGRADQAQAAFARTWSKRFAKRLQPR